MESQLIPKIHNSSTYCSCLICNTEVPSSSTTIIIKSEDGCVLNEQTSFNPRNPSPNLSQVETFCQLVNLSFSTAEQVSSTNCTTDSNGKNGGISFCTDCTGILNNVTCLLEQIAKLHQEVDGYKVQVESQIKQSYIKHVNGRSCKRRGRPKASTIKGSASVTDSNSNAKSSSTTIKQHSCSCSPATSICCTRTDKLRELIISELQSNSSSGVEDPLSAEIGSVITTCSILLSTTNNGEVEINTCEDTNPGKDPKRKRSGRNGTSVPNNTASLNQDSEHESSDDDRCYELYIPPNNIYNDDDSDDPNEDEDESQRQEFGLKSCSVDLDRMKCETALGLPSSLLQGQPKRERKPSPGKKSNEKSRTSSNRRRRKPLKLSCPDCSLTFNSEHLLTKHQIDIHAKECPFFCHKCGRATYSQKKLDTHLPKCKKTPLPSNVTVSTLVGPSKISCNDCGYATARADRMKLHLLSHSKEKRFVCELCGSGFSRKPALTEHKLLKHYEEPSSSQDAQQQGDGDPHPYKCSFEGCGRIFGNNKNLRMHEKRHRSEFDFICPTCGYAAVSAGILKRHEQHVHLGLRKHKCVQCDESYKTSTALIRHVRGAHTAEEDKPFKCSYCGKGFRDKFPLKQHEISVHTNEKPIECSICGKRFAIKTYLNIHMRVHQGRTTQKKKSIFNKNDEEEMEITTGSALGSQQPIELNLVSTQGEDPLFVDPSIV